MDMNAGGRVTRLRRGEFLRVSDGAGRTVVVFSGLLWITQDGDRRDIFVNRGQTFVLDRPGLAIVEAIEDTRLIVLEPESAPRRTPRVGTHEHALA